MGMNGVLFDILVGVIITCTVLVTAHLIPYLRRLIYDSRYAELLNVIDTAVDALEQTVKQSGAGNAKKAEVVKFVHAWLNTHDIYITEEQLDKLIEAAVFAMNHNKKEN